MRWNGTRWKRVPSPNRSDSENWLFAVDGTSSRDIWAVGYDLDAELRHRMLVLHWNGARWRVVPTPSVGEDLESTLVGVEALSPTDVWAVGTATAWPFIGQTFTVHWDGQGWSRVDSPNPSTEGLGSSLLDVAASSADDIWAVGDYDPSGAFEMQPLAEHWDGVSWSVVPIPALSESAILSGLGVAAADDVWAVGNQGLGTLIAHWDGRSWTLVPGVDPGELASSLTAVAKVPGSGCLWAVGQFTDGERAKAFIERSCAS